MDRRYLDASLRATVIQRHSTSPLVAIALAWRERYVEVQTIINGLKNDNGKADRNNPILGAWLEPSKMCSARRADDR